MVDQRLIAARVTVIDDNLKLVKRLGKHPRERFARTPEFYMLAERALHLVLEAILDIASHITSDRELGSPESYADSIRCLADGKVITQAMAKKLIPWVGFRNLLVHGYIKLDHGRTHDAIRKDLGPLDAYLRAISKLL